MEYKEFEKRVLDIRSLSNKPLETKIKKLFNDISIPMQLPVGMPSENSFGQWIKTTDKFPKPEMMGEKILIVYKNEIHIGKIAPNGWNLFCSDGNCYFHIPIMDEVTHWMPLPKL